MAAAAPAQLGGHPHIADPAPGAIVLPRISPMLNLGDGQWNLGEALAAQPDTGGYLGQDPDPAYAPSEVKILQDWTVSGTLRKFTGELRQGTAEKPKCVASFEIVAPDEDPLREHVVVVLSVAQTSGSAVAANAVYDPYIYPGDPARNGLWDQPLPQADDVVLHFMNQSPDFHAVGAHIVPRTSFRPLTFVMQRLRQLREVVLDRLSAEFGHDPAKTTFVVAGGSFGGLPPQLAVILHPDEFHAGFGGGYSGNTRGLPSDQASHDFFASALGRGFSGGGYGPRDALEYSVFARIVQSDLTGLSLVNRVRWDDVRRPLHFLIGDEDPVAHGTDWIGMLDPTGTTNHDHDRVLIPNSNPPAYIGWSVVPKGCHGDIAYADPYKYAGDPADGWYHDGKPVVYDMVEQARQQEGVAVGPPPVSRAKHPSLVTLDPHEHALNRKSQRIVPPSSKPNLLQPAPVPFQRLGHGTWLAAVSAKCNGQAPCDSVFAGSADGVVTRFEKQPVVCPSPVGTIEPLVEVARSNKSGVDYAVGWGAWALAVGDVKTGGDNEVVVGAYRRIAVLNADTLECVCEADLPIAGLPGPDWAYGQPRGMTIADVSSAPGNEIVFATPQGGVIVLDQSLQLLAAHEESGIIDLAVGPAPAPRVPGGTFTKPNLRVLKHDGASLSICSEAPLGDPNATAHDFEGYGACGIAIAELEGNGGAPEILVTTANGELVVFPWTGSALGSPIHYRLMEGSIGAFNSIVVADLIPDPQNKVEVYVAGSMGIRRFDLP